MVWLTRPDFDDIWQKYSKYSKNINFSTFKSDAENSANFDAVSSKHANFYEVHLKHRPTPKRRKRIIFGTHNHSADI